MNLLDTFRVSKTAYNPESYVLVERFHCYLKSYLNARLDQIHGYDKLSLALLCLRKRK